MRRFLLTFIVLTSMFSTTMAQPAMSNKGYVDNNLTKVDTVCQDEGNRTLTPEIYAIYADIHYQHPTAITCPFWMEFGTTENYSWWKWNINGQEFNTPVVEYYFEESGYIKVEVGNDDGDTGTDSIYFDVKTHFEYDSITLEVDENGYQSVFMKFSPLEISLVFVERCNNNMNWTTLAVFDPYGPTPVPENGEIQLSYQDVEINNDVQWTYRIFIDDTCRYSELEVDVPGMFLATTQESNEWMLDMKTTINQFGPLEGFEYVYLVYTIDEYGQRHHYTGENGPVVLPQSATSWTIPGQHIDPYYQVGVAWVHEDGSYELVSLSNKVENPLHATGIEEQTQDLMVYPNPAQGRFTVEGTGHLMVSNMLGQTIMTKEIDGKATIELPQGLYFVKLNGATRKIVVE